MTLVLAVLAAIVVIVAVLRVAMMLAERKVEKRRYSGAVPDHNEGAQSAVAPDGSVDFGGAD